MLPEVPGAAPGAVTIYGSLHEAPGAQTIYDVGPTRVSFLSVQPSNFAVAERASAETIFVVSGIFYLSNRDGSARRCEAGDTIVLPNPATHAILRQLKDYCRERKCVGHLLYLKEGFHT